MVLRSMHAMMVAASWRSLFSSRAWGKEEGGGGGGWKRLVGEKNAHKTMDPDLALAIFDEVEKQIKEHFVVE